MVPGDECLCLLGCESGQWTCRNGQCIDDRQRCDGLPHCIDMSDEEACEGGGGGCGPSELVYGLLSAACGPSTGGLLAAKEVASDAVHKHRSIKVSLLIFCMIGTITLLRC